MATDPTPAERWPAVAQALDEGSAGPAGADLSEEAIDLLLVFYGQAVMTLGQWATDRRTRRDPRPAGAVRTLQNLARRWGLPADQVPADRLTRAELDEALPEDRDPVTGRR